MEVEYFHRAVYQGLMANKATQTAKGRSFVNRSKSKLGVQPNKTLSKWSEELLRETLPIRQHMVSELDLLINKQKAEIHARQSTLWGEEDLADAMNDSLLMKLIETRREAAESVEEIEDELQRRSNRSVTRRSCG
jgi:hypothetical protein